MRFLAKLVVGGLLGAVGAGAACSSEPLPKPGTTDDDAGAAGAEASAGTKATGGTGGTLAAVGAPSYVAIDNDPGCPEQASDWSKLKGGSCKGTHELVCYKVWDCQPGDVSYGDEYLSCLEGTWAWHTKNGSCDASRIELGADGCPTGDASQAEGLPCSKEGLDCSTPELTDCGVEGAYYSEYVTCFNRRWRLDFDEGDCTCDDCGIGGAGGVGGTTATRGGAGGAGGASR